MSPCLMSKSLLFLEVNDGSHINVLEARISKGLPAWVKVPHKSAKGLHVPHRVATKVLDTRLATRREMVGYVSILP